MSVVAFASVKSSPGTTTAVMAAGHVWPAGRAVLVVEAESGGDLAARYGLRPEPGLTSLAAAGRRALSCDLLFEHAQGLAGLPTLLAPPTGAHTRAALDVLGTSLGPTLAEVGAEVGADVLIDCGRLDPASPALALARSADLVVIVTRPIVAELPRVAARAAELAAEGCALSLLLVGESSPSRQDRYPAGEIAAALGIGVIGILADDAQGAALLSGSSGTSRTLERCPLVRSARDVVGAFLTQLSTITPLAGVRNGDGPPPAIRRRTIAEAAQ